MTARRIIVAAIAALVLVGAASAADPVSVQPGTQPGGSADQAQGPATIERHGTPTGSVVQGRGDEVRAAQQAVIGKVQSIEGDTVVVKSDNRLSDPHRIHLGDDTRITRSEREVSREQLKEGDEVLARFTGEGDAKEAVEISIIRPGQPGDAATSAPTTATPDPSSAAAGPSGAAAPSGSSAGTQTAPGSESAGQR